MHGVSPVRKTVVGTIVRRRHQQGVPQGKRFIPTQTRVGDPVSLGGGLKARKNGRLNAALGPAERLMVSNGEKRRPALQQKRIFKICE
jgi:hypothetical protein